MKKAILILLVLGFIKSYSQDRTNTINIGFIDSLQSKVLNENRKFWVHIPQKFNENCVQQKYPVLYLLDGPDHFVSVTGLIQKLSTSLGDEICPEMIIIGIESKDRVKDFLPVLTENKEENSKNIKQDDFTTFLEKELIPYIDTVYPTLPYRILIGHSLGGLKVVNTLVYHTKLFNSYVAIDPSLGHFRNKIFDLMESDFNKPDYSKTTLYLAMAQTMPPNTELSFIKSDTTSATNHMRTIMKFADIMNAKDKTIDFNWKYYPEETHGSLPLIAEYDALYYIFRWYDIRKIRQIYYIENDGDSVKNIIANHFIDVSKKMRLTYLPPERMVDEMFGYYYSKGKFKTAFSLLKLNHDNYPGSAYSKYYYELGMNELYWGKKKSLNELLSEKSLKEIHVLCLSESKKKDPEYNISEIAINTLGYKLIEEKKLKEALEFFKINTELYPNSSNVFDSYGELLMLIGKEKEGLAAYKKSFELDPKNMNAENILKKYNYK
jgi:hypothetical protein